MERVRLQCVVMKFGGTSVASASGWAVIERAVTAVLSEGHRPVVVCSAIGGVSDLLEELLETAAAGCELHLHLRTLRRLHADLAAELGIRLPAEVDALLDEVSDVLVGVRLVGEASPRTQARVLASGELMSTHLGAAWLRSRGCPVTWRDARDLLLARAPEGAPDDRRFLSGVVSPERGAVDLSGAEAVLTQGFIARDADGDTAVLGRGGSDTSAAYLGVLTAARRVEIWTDVPGMFTTNPAGQPRARHLQRLAYDEAEVLATLGARVLHPRCLAPLRDAAIPLHIRSTYLPDVDGTVVTNEVTPGVKGVAERKHLTLLTMTRPPCWQPVGFLADISTRFRDHGMSIDLLASSPSTITATIDPMAAPTQDFESLLRDLGEVCDVELTDGVASVSLVGTEVAQVLEVVDAHGAFSGIEVHMLAHGASDHHVTWVVDGDAVFEAAARLHRLLFEDAQHVAGPEWTALQGDAADVPRRWSREVSA